MKPSISITALALFMVMIAPSARAEIAAEASVSGGYQNNLFSDSSTAGDSYASIGLDLKYYPSGSTQLAAGLRYSAYSTFRDLSNLTGEASLVVIPTPESSAVSLTLSGKMTTRTFGAQYELYDQAGLSVGANAGYRLLSTVTLGSSFMYGSNQYIHSDIGSNYGFDAASGINLTLPGYNSLTIEADYTRRMYEQWVPPPGEAIGPFSDRSGTETFAISGILVRFARPLGTRTGLHLSAGRRLLQMETDYTAPGYTIDYLSPWADLWEGTSFTAGVKHFFPRQIVAEISAEYSEKNFADVLERDENTGEIYRQVPRHDRLTIVSLTLTRPVARDNGTQFLPQLYLGYRKNQSAMNIFEYEDFVVVASLLIGL